MTNHYTLRIKRTKIYPPANYDGCWIWKYAGTTPLWRARGKVLAERLGHPVLWEKISTSCGNAGCVNPAHLRAG